MFQNATIRYLSAMLMLLIFLFSITSKRHLHDLLADHEDTVMVKVTDGQAHVATAGFSCDANSLVTTSPFTEEKDEITIVSVRLYSLYFSSYTNPEYTSTPSFFELRGPPALG